VGPAELLVDGPAAPRPADAPRVRHVGIEIGEKCHRSEELDAPPDEAHHVGSVIGDESYDIERRAVAETNVGYSAKRGSGMIKMIEAVRRGDLDAVRAGIAARPSGGRQGMDLGFRYEAGAVASDGTTPPPVANPMADYAQNGCPGGRAPHLWVQRDGERVSTLDTFGRGLVLFTGTDGAAWRAAAEEAATSPRIPIEVLTVGEAGDLQAPAGRFEALYGIEPDGAVLVRPDGFVGWRAPRAVDNPVDALAGALATILKF